MPESKRSRVPVIVGWSLTALALVALASAAWIRYRFGKIVFEQFILHIPLGGEAGNNSLFGEALAWCILLPLALVGLALLVRQRRGWRLTGRRRIALPTLALTAGVAVLLAVIGFPKYAAAQFDQRSFADYYVTPTAGHVPERPKNLITIYLESLENTFGDTDLFGRNLLSVLDEATDGWGRYETLRQYPEGGWTMAGIIGTQCAIPLKSQLLVEGINPNNFGEQMPHYLPGASCLGDVLAEAGYSNTYVGGANTRFAGKDTFLADHGYTSIRGREVWEPEEDPSEISVWGLSDHRMFAHAADTLDELRASGQPYHLTMLSLDTHEPGGVYPSCTTDDAVPMATAITCSTQALAGFLAHAEKAGALEDTVIVVMGDHLKATAEGGYYKTELDGTADRSIVLRIWSPDGVSFTRQNADQFSMLATTLDLLGLEPPDGRAGLGISFVGDHSATGTALELSPEDYETVMTSPSRGLYRTFWEAPESAATPTDDATQEPEAESSGSTALPVQPHQ